MRIESIRIRNFRSFADETIRLDGYTCIVGANGAGKSNVLSALNVFFRESSASATNPSVLHEEDFHLKRTESPISITITFINLAIDAKQELAAYVRDDRLVVTALAAWDDAAKEAKVQQRGERFGIKEFASFFEQEKLGAKAPELQKIYDALRAEFDDLPAVRSKEDKIEELHKYESAHPAKCSLLQSEDQFYGFTKGANRLSKYIQWVYVPAVKDASDEQNESRDTALWKLLARTVRGKVSFSDRLKGIRDTAQSAYQELLAEHQITLKEISDALEKKLVQWSHPDARLKLQWQQDTARSVQVAEPFASIVAGEGIFDGQLSRFGHGLQRSYILALLHELAVGGITEGTTLILGCEEPELYQHPPQARYLASVLEQLGNGGAQVLVTTHSPIFVTGRNFESVRLVRLCYQSQASEVRQVDALKLAEQINKLGAAKSNAAAALIAKLHQVLQPNLNEMFFTRRLVLVEGLEDVAYLHAWLTLTNRLDDYRRAGFHTVAANGKSELIHPIAVAKSLQIPVFAIWDCDAKERGKKHEAEHRKDNLALFQLFDVQEPDPFPTFNCWGHNYVAWADDIATSIKADVSEPVWNTTFTKASNEFANAGRMSKCTMHIGAHLAYLLGECNSLPTLEKLTESILRFSG